MPSPPRFRRSAPDERRRALIEACAGALAQKGRDGATVREIARRASISPGLIGHYYVSIDLLVAATYRHVGTTIGAALDAAIARGTTPDERLRQFIAAHFEPPVLDGDLLAIWTAFWSLVRRDPAIHAIHAEISAGYRRQLYDLLVAAKCEHRLPADEAALTLTAMLDGLWLEHCLDPTSFRAPEAVEMVMRWIDLNRV
jgi:TetR/AcrR family transcriptional regulator, transcriptional repressor of bet genes